MNDINAAPLVINNKDSLAAFGAEVAKDYQSRELFLKNHNQNVSKDQFVDGIFKIKQNIGRLNKSSEVYKANRTGVNLFELKEKQEALGPTKTGKKGRGRPKKPSAPEGEPIVTDPVSEFLSRETEEEGDDFTTPLASPTASPPPESTLEELRQKRDILDAQLDEFNKNVEETEKLDKRNRQNKTIYEAAVKERDEKQKEYDKINGQIFELKQLEKRNQDMVIISVLIASSTTYLGWKFS